MRKIFNIITIIIIVLFLIGSSSAMNPAFLDLVIPYSGGGCPEWATYGTSTGNIRWAWDGNHASGEDYACDASETPVASNSESGVTYGGSGVDKYVEINADSDHLSWAVDASDFDDPSPLTIWIEIQIAENTSSNKAAWVWKNSTGTSPNRYAYLRLDSSNPATCAWISSSYDYVSDGNYIDDGSTWDDIACSFDVGKSGSDHFSSITSDSGDGWRRENDSLVNWSSVPAEFVLGNDGTPAGNSVVMRIRRLVVLVGTEQACPW